MQESYHIAEYLNNDVIIFLKNKFLQLCVIYKQFQV